jgi:hypothetical protein
VASGGLVSQVKEKEKEKETHEVEKRSNRREIETA